MNKIQSFLHHLNGRGHGTTLSTPVAIIIGSIIIALGIMGYGYTSRPSAASGTSGPQDLVKVVAKDLKLKGSAWESCLASPEIAQQVTTDFNDGTAAGVSGTPTTFVLLKKNGIYETVEKIVGAQPESVLTAVVERALTGSAPTTPFTGLPIADDEFVNGTKGDVLILTYADAECPFCVRFHPSVLSTMETYGDRIGFAYRHFPLSFHPNAVPYAIAIECAGKIKGKEAYFGFIDKLFAKQAENF